MRDARERSRTITAAAAIIALALLLALGGGLADRGEAASPVTLKCATATLNDVQHEWCNRYGARLEKRSNGQIKTQIFPASQLGSIPRMIEGTQLGTIESWMGPPEFLVGIDARFQVLSAPYLFDDFDHAYRVINDRQFLDRFLALAEDRGLKGVSLIAYGPAGFGNRTPIRVPDDMKGKKFRVLATPIEMAMVSALGATGVPMPLGEVLTALQQGAIDGSES